MGGENPNNSFNTFATDGFLISVQYTPPPTSDVHQSNTFIKFAVLILEHHSDCVTRSPTISYFRLNYLSCLRFILRHEFWGPHPQWCSSRYPSSGHITDLMHYSHLRMWGKRMTCQGEKNLKLQDSAGEGDHGRLGGCTERYRDVRTNVWTMQTDCHRDRAGKEGCKGRRSPNVSYIATTCERRKQRWVQVNCPIYWRSFSKMGSHMCPTRLSHIRIGQFGGQTARDERGDQTVTRHLSARANKWEIDKEAK